MLGTILQGTVDGVVRRARIVETEAYVGAHDLASHARFGRTKRNESMWGPPGRTYVYLVYGLHSMLNVVTAPEGDPQAVLVRAAEPLDGWDARPSGPGLLAAAFHLTRADDGADLVAGPLTLEPGTAPRRIEETPRIGVGYARGDWRDRLLRYVDADSAHVSRR